MAKTTRITIPTVPGDLIQLAEDIETKHTALGKDSPLGLLKWDMGSADRVDRRPNAG